MDEKWETCQQDFRNKTGLMLYFPVDCLQIQGCLKKNMETNVPLNKVKVAYYPFWSYYHF